MTFKLIGATLLAGAALCGPAALWQQHREHAVEGQRGELRRSHRVRADSRYGADPNQDPARRHMRGGAGRAWGGENPGQAPQQR